MRKKEVSYSKKTIVRLIWTGILVAGVIILTMGTACFAGRLSMKVKAGLLVFDCILFAVYFAEVYRDMYRPWCELEKIVHERKDRKTETLADANIAQRDLIKEIQEIISSLENITIRQKNSEILMKVAEINNLQDQINPHFLYNTLEVIRGEALINGDKKVAEMTEALANYFRYNISRKETFVYLKDELKNICNYFKIQQHRFGDRISFEIVYHGIEEKDVQNCYIPKLILQPIVENSIYHGLEMKIGGGVIKIHISSADDKLMLTNC